MSLIAISAHLLNAFNAKPGKSDDATSARLVLIASFLQGSDVTETLISEGQYVKAIAVLKQDMEMLVRIHETIAGVAKIGQTPQMRYLPVEGARRFYGELNKVAHPSTSTSLRACSN